MMKLRASKMTITMLLTASVLAACSKQTNNPAISGSGMSSVGVIAGTTVNQQTYTSVKEARIREQDGKRIFEYKDPTSEAEKWQTYGTIITVPIGAQFYHWGPTADVAHWVKNGISKKEIADDITRVNTSNVMGGGFYISSSPVDSSGYGEGQLVVKASREMTFLDVNGSSNIWKQQELGINVLNNTLLPVSIIEAAGIEAIKYTRTWHVTINGSALENLFEGSWINFLENIPADEKNISSFLQFAGKYTLTEEISKNPKIQETFPIAAKFFSDQNLSEADRKEAAVAVVSGSGFSIQSEAMKTPVIEKFLLQIRDAIKIELKAKIQAAVVSPSMYEMASVIYSVKSFGYTIDDFDLGHMSFENVNLTGLTASATKNLGNFTILNNPKSMAFITSIMSIGLLPAIEKLSASNSSDLGAAANDPNPFSDNLNFDDKRFLKLATHTQGAEVVYRDQPMSATGSDYFDDQDELGYFEVSRVQKEELENTPWILPRFAEKVDEKTGTLKFYARYEYPSAKNFIRFAHKLEEPALFAEWNRALLDGELKDVTSPTFRRLNQEIVQAVVKEILSNSYKPMPNGKYLSKSSAYFVLMLSRVMPFADEKVANKTMGAFGALRTIATDFLDSNLAKKITLFEVEILSANTSSDGALVALGLKGAKSDDFELDKAYGMWATAANCDGPHKSPEELTRKLYATYLTPEVRELISMRQYLKVRQRLHKAVEGDCAK